MYMPIAMITRHSSIVELAADLVGHAAEDDRAEAHADQLGREDDAELGARDAPFLGDARRGEGARQHVEPVERVEEDHQHDDDPLPRAHRVVVDHRDRVGARLRSRHVLLSSPRHRANHSWIRASISTSFSTSSGVKRPFSQASCSAMQRLGVGQRLDARLGQVERLLARVAGRALAAQVVALLQAVDDGHRRRPVHLQALADLDLRDAGMVADQPQHADLLLGQLEVGEGLGEVAIDGDVGQADMEADDVRQRADVVVVVAARSKPPLDATLYPSLIVLLPNR